MRGLRRFEKRSLLAHPAREVFDWHLRPGALERLTPPWTGVRVESRSGDLREDGATVVLRMPVGPLSLRWVATHHDYVDGVSFRDHQASGPFASWDHTHRVTATEGGTLLEDSIDYRLPLAPASTLLADRFVRGMLDATFAWRHRRTREDLAAHARAGLEPSRVAISGASGLVGSQLAAFLGTGGHRVLRMVRPGAAAASQADTVAWDPSTGVVDTAALEGVDAVVHLAGENIAAGRWSEDSKGRILASRVDGTRALARGLSRLQRRPKVLVAASAIGFYGHRGDEALDEGSEAGEGFLPEVCRRWEEATREAADAGIRVVHLRIGVVLTPEGGALERMLLPFRLGLGGPLGDGRAFLSWITLDDVLGAILHCLATPGLEGPVNATAPAPVPNARFASDLGAALGRPALLPVPAFALKAALGEMAEALLLSSTRVLPRRLEESGYVFRDPDLRRALADMLGRAAHEENR